MAGEIKASARFEFPTMVYDMLEEVSYDKKTSAIVSWMPHGRAFKVHKPDNFEAEVMPKYFRERYSSFRFLLEQWSFHGLRRGRDRGAYYNVNFVRGERHRIVNISKEFMEDTMPKYLAPRDEPDFYSMEPALSKPQEVSTRKPPSDRKRKATQPSRPKTKSAPAAVKTNNARKRVRANPRKGSEIKRESEPLENQEAYLSESSQESEDEEFTVPEARAPLRRTPRLRQQPQYDEERPSRPRQSIASASSKESSSRKNSRLSHDSMEEFGTKDDDSAEDDSMEESPMKDSSPILLPPSKPVFSGFNLPFKNFKKLKLVVMSSGDLEGEDPFAIKRPKRETAIPA